MAAAAVLAAVASCTTRERIPRGPIKTIDGLVSSLAEVMCGWQFRCCSGPELVALGNAAPPKYAACVAATRLTLDEKLAAPSAAVARERMLVDPARASACLETFEARACNPSNNNLGFPAPGPWDLLGRCLDPFVGRVAIGETCFLSNECEPASRCLAAGGPVDDGTGGLLPDGRRVSQLLVGVTSRVGVCHAYRGLHDPCTLTEECDPSRNLYCRRTDFRCATAAQKGEECSMEFDPVNGAERPVIACDANAGLFCANGFCRPPPRNGEPCLAFGTSLDQCDPTVEPPLDCVGEDFNGTGTCKIPGLVGAACGGTGLPACDSSLACIGDLLGTCGLTPAAGATCSVDFRCAPPAVCHLGQNRCVMPGDGATGSACSRDEDCATLFCGLKFDSGGAACLTSPEVPVICAGAGATPVPGGNVGPGGGFDGSFDLAASAADAATDAGIAVSPPPPKP